MATIPGSSGCAGPGQVPWEDPNPFEIMFSFLVVMVVVKFGAAEGFKGRLKTMVLK